MHLSIIIPAYNEEHRLPPTLEKVLAFAEAQEYDCEVLVVDNGSEDGTAEVVRSLCGAHPCLRLLSEPRRGKGLAVRHGMLEAAGEYRFMCDADLSMPIEQVERFLPPTLPDFDVAIGSRRAKGAMVTRSLTRTLLSRVFNIITRLVALPGIRDTLCGFKCFRAEVAEDVFRRQRLAGFAFDVEIMAIARHRKWRIVEVPVTWVAVASAQKTLIFGTPKAVLDLLTIRSNVRNGLYDDSSSE